MALVLTLLVSLTSRSYLPAESQTKGTATRQREVEGRRRAAQALNRLTFGPRPGEIDRVVAMGVDNWIDRQLHPDIIDDSTLDVRLRPFRTLRMDTREIVENFPPPQLIKAVEAGKRPLPSDAMQRVVYETQMDRLQSKKRAKQTDDSAESDPPTDLQPDQRASRHEINVQTEIKIQQLLELSPDDRVKKLLSMPAEERRQIASSLRGAKRERFLSDLNPEDRETVMALNNPQQVVVGELLQGKLLRATYSERQFEEVLTDFWFNHFNVFIGKGADRYLLTSYERDVIRPHVMGKFEDLLVATAQSPAMLFYLDNWLSVGTGSEAATRSGRSSNKRTKDIKSKRSGLNENYGRELMELHTLGVNGGYTQKDVTEVARVFTGWTIKRPREGNGFTFDERMHEPGDKIVLGHRIKSNGEKEGLEVLHVLAHHPSTARFVCTKIAIRFVSDDPPRTLVDQMTKTFLQKDGDIREVLRTMLRSDEFWSEKNHRAKVKTPLEFVVSALRASDAQMTDAMPVARILQTLGMPLYGMQPPTGYSTKADAWVNSAALLGRMNFALALTSGKLKGTEVDLSKLASDSDDPAMTLASLEHSLLAGEISPQTHETLAARLQDPKITRRVLDDPPSPVATDILAGLILGSPEFQRK
ncbi:MAG TPA: DUF1800 domain-containing protein [Terriglobales bacterium]